MFGLKIFVWVQTFRRVPPVLPRNFCHPGVDDVDAQVGGEGGRSGAWWTPWPGWWTPWTLGEHFDQGSWAPDCCSTCALGGIYHLSSLTWSATSLFPDTQVPLAPTSSLSRITLDLLRRAGQHDTQPLEGEVGHKVYHTIILNSNDSVQ